MVSAIRAMIVAAVWPVKGRPPVAVSYRITPRAQMSAAAVLRQENILGLEIPVNDPAGMDIGHGLGQAPGKGLDFGDR